MNYWTGLPESPESRKKHTREEYLSSLFRSSSKTRAADAGEFRGPRPAVSEDGSEEATGLNAESVDYEDSRTDSGRETVEFPLQAFTSSSITAELDDDGERSETT
ncbi:uncharacterized protein LOC144120041 [Amblyomma americanum]